MYALNFGDNWAPRSSSLGEMKIGINQYLDCVLFIGDPSPRHTCFHRIRKVVAAFGARFINQRVTDSVEVLGCANARLPHP
jgi:hypothetical protein